MASGNGSAVGLPGGDDDIVDVVDEIRGWSGRQYVECFAAALGLYAAVVGYPVLWVLERFGVDPLGVDDLEYAGVDGFD